MTTPVDAECDLSLDEPLLAEQISAGNRESDRSKTTHGIRTEQHAVPKHVAKDLVHGTSALGISMVVERGFGFLANLLAARFGGASTFGAYALGISTANNISSYAAGGIGSTAVRFAGKYGADSAGYRTLVKSLAIISLVSAALAAVVLWAGAAPIARLLGTATLTPLLRWAALSAAGMILLECCRGFLVGQRRIAAIVVLSLCVGVGMLSVLPLAARSGPVPMICAQVAITFGAVGVCVLLYKPLGLAASALRSSRPEALGQMLKEVWSFGLVQLAGLVGMNAAGWWLITCVARRDASLAQVSFLSISQQLRNLVGLFPGMLTESSLGVMARNENGVGKTPDQVMAVCTLVATLVSLSLTGIGVVILPWALLAYGSAYQGAVAATAWGLATAVVHMSSSPASARVSILSIRTTGVINTVWALMVAGGATLFFFFSGDAARGMAIYCAAHLVSAVLVFSFLGRRACLPDGMTLTFTVGAVEALLLVMLAFARIRYPEYQLALSAAMLLTLCAAVSFLFRLGRRHCWLPSFALMKRFITARILVRPDKDIPASEGGLNV